MFYAKEPPAAGSRTGCGIFPSLFGALLATLVIGGLAGVMLLLRVAAALPHFVS